MSMKGSWKIKTRIKRVIKKEFLSFICDKGAVLTMFVGPLMIMTIFGYTFQADVKELKTVIIDEDNSRYSGELNQAIEKSEYFAPIQFQGDLEEARGKLRKSEVRAVFHIPKNFGEDLDNGVQGKVELYLDSSDYAIYNILKGASGDVLKNSLHNVILLIIGDLEKERDGKQKEIEAIGAMAARADADSKRIKRQIQDDAPDRERIYRQVEEIQNRIKNIRLDLKTMKKEFLAMAYDIDRRYEFGQISYFAYLTPAILSLLLFHLGIVVTTINIVDERNAKTLFRVAITPLGKIEFFGGKFIIFLMIGMIEILYTLALAIFLFDVKIAGSILSVIIVLFLLIAACTGLGLLISTVVKTMRQASMLMPLVVIPSVLLSQTFSPIEVMPRFMQYFAYLSPMLYSNIALREIMIKGTSIFSLLMPVLILAGYALITLSLGIAVYKKRIG